MLTSAERAALVLYCHDHRVAVCRKCGEMVTVNRIGTDLILAKRDFCPACRADLTTALRKHLTECTWIRAQARETRERAQEIRGQAQETAKESRQLRDNADVLAREAEAALERSRDVKRGQPPADGGAGMTPSLAGIRVIVVESHEDMRDMLDQSLRMLGAMVLAVTTAPEALLQIDRADVIVTDVALPDEDGVWLWERVNLQLRPVPVIAVTGYTAEQYPRIRQAKFAWTLLKPVDPNELAKVIVEIVRPATPTTALPTE